MMQNITTAVGINHRGYDCKCRVYSRLIIIDLHICTKACCVGCGRCKDVLVYEGSVIVIELFLA